MPYDSQGNYTTKVAPDPVTGLLTFVAPGTPVDIARGADVQPPPDPADS
jgi:hypothetical protein